MSSTALYTEKLFPLRIDKPLKDEIARLAEKLGIPKSQLVRCSLRFTLDKNTSEIDRIIKQWKAESDAWYEKRNEAKNDGK